MYRRIAIKITDWFIKKGTIDEAKKEIYYYGFELLLSSTIYFLIFLGIAFFTKSVFASFFFWLGLFIVRKVAGGHHAGSYRKCHLLFAANHIAFVILLKLFPISLYYISIIVILLFSLLSILLFAPVDHKNKPFIKTEYKRFKRFSRIYCLILAIIIVVFSLKIFKANSLVFGFAIGTLSATISLLCAKIIRAKERKQKT